MHRAAALAASCSTAHAHIRVARWHGVQRPAFRVAVLNALLEAALAEEVLENVGGDIFASRIEGFAQRQEAGGVVGAGAAIRSCERRMSGS
jgi:hypothetical protein